MDCIGTSRRQQNRYGNTGIFVVIIRDSSTTDPRATHLHPLCTARHHHQVEHLRGLGTIVTQVSRQFRLTLHKTTTTTQRVGFTEGLDMSHKKASRLLCLSSYRKVHRIRRVCSTSRALRRPDLLLAVASCNVTTTSTQRERIETHVTQRPRQQREAKCGLAMTHLEATCNDITETRHDPCATVVSMKGPHC